MMRSIILAVLICLGFQWDCHGQFFFAPKKDSEYYAQSAQPIITSWESGALAFTENGSAVAISSTVAVTDSEATITEARVTVKTGRQFQDLLTYPVQIGAIVGTAYNTTTGVLQLTGVDTKANYNTALRSITYEFTGDNPGTSKVLSIAAKDTVGYGAAVTRNVTVTAINDPPKWNVSPEATALAYTEGDGNKFVTATATCGDFDSINLEGATIQITTGYNSGEDVLGYDGVGAIGAVWDSGTGTLTLSGTDHITTGYTTAIREVYYVNDGSPIDTTTRTLTFQLDDGTDLSPTVTRDIDVMASGPVQPGPKPAKTITGANLYTADQAAVNGSTGFAFGGNGSYDATVTRTADGSGSIKLDDGTSNFTLPLLDLVALGEPPPGWYVLSWYQRTTNGPMKVNGQIQNYGPIPVSFLRNSGSLHAIPSQDGVWEEFATHFYLQSDVGRIVPQILTAANQQLGNTGHIHLDDFYLAQQDDIGFRTAPQATHAGHSQSKIVIDGLGNIMLNGAQFVPFGFQEAVGVGSPSLAQYAAQGFNLRVDGNTISAVTAAKDEGLKCFFNATGYLLDGNPLEGDITLLNSRLNAINNEASYDAWDWCLGLYLDNEIVTGEGNIWIGPDSGGDDRGYDDVIGAYNTINAGQNSVYILQGGNNQSPPFGETYSGFAGTYAQARANDPETTVNSLPGVPFDRFARHPTTQTPTIAQINPTKTDGLDWENAGDLRLSVYANLMVGAKGFLVYFGSPVPVDSTTRSIWADIPNIGSELTTLAPLIKTEHWATWTVSADDTDVMVSARDDGTTKSIWIVNRTTTEQASVTFTTSGTGAPSGLTVKDYFDDSTITTQSGNDFTWTVPALGVDAGSAVFYLE